MADKILHGRGAIPGVVEGVALVSRETIGGWGCLDEKTGLVIEKGHPWEGLYIKGAVLVLPGGKGSNGWSIHFHGTKIANIGPAAFVFPAIDSRTGVTVAVLDVPTVTDLVEDPFEFIHTGDWVRVDGDRGIVEINSGNSI
jgi:predicted aconitase with swiveling domain